MIYKPQITDKINIRDLLQMRKKTLMSNKLFIQKHLYKITLLEINTFTFLKFISSLLQYLVY